MNFIEIFSEQTSELRRNEMSTERLTYFLMSALMVVDDEVQAGGGPAKRNSSSQTADDNGGKIMAEVISHPQ